MNSKNKFEKLLRRTGILKSRIESVLHLQPLRSHGSNSIFELYQEAVKQCCRMDRPDVLRDIASYVQTNKCGDSTVEFDGVNVYLCENFPVNIVLTLVDELFEKRIISLLPSYVQAVLDVSAIGNTPIKMGSLTRGVITMPGNVDKQLATDGHKALLETMRMLLNTGCVRSHDMLCALRPAIPSWRLDGGLTVEHIERHFQFLVHVAELFIKHKLSADQNYIYSILCTAKTQIISYERMKSTYDNGSARIHLANINAVMDGLGDVFRCFVLAGSLAPTFTIFTDTSHLSQDDSCLWLDESALSRMSSIIAIIGYSYQTGRSKKLIELLFDAVSSAEVTKLKKIWNLQVNPDNFHSPMIKALEYLNEIELPRSLQHLARRAIHQALWDRKLPGAVGHAIDHATLSTLGLTECMVNYCMYY